MGARHVSAVYATWHHLPDPAFRLLVYMALVAKDANDEPRFWGGRRVLAFGIARGVPDGEPIPAATVTAIKRCIRVLTSEGAVEIVYGGWRGKNAEYRLHLDGPRKGSGRRDRKGVAPRPSIETSEQGERGSPGDPERGSPGDPKGGRPTTERGSPHDPPRKNKDHKERTEEETSPLTQPSPTADDDKTTSPEITPLEAKRIVREAVDAGAILSEITQGHTFRNRVERDIFIATEITRRAAS